MKTSINAIAIIIFMLINTAYTITAENSIAKGKQPQVALDAQGTIRIVLGLNDEILCTSSTDHGMTFSTPVTVGHVKEMHLGMSRGPQIASTANYSIITAMDNGGNIHTFRLNHGTKQWNKIGRVNDVQSSAPEGLMSIAADDQDNFFAVWLDIRQDSKNKIYVASMKSGATQWSKNVMAYKSPEGTVCECCKPNITVKNSKIYVMFRNWLNGSRDMYVMQSDHESLSFTSPQKIGEGTWKLNGCPMDGGGIFIDDQNAVHTTWQREGKIFYCQPYEKEIQVGEGRASSISGQKNPVIAWQEGSMLKIKYLHSGKEINVGEGAFIRVIALDNKKVLCVWENDNNVYSIQL